jgi:hypothetical protein
VAQSRRGVTQILEAQVHPLIVAIPRFMRQRHQKLNKSWYSHDFGGLYNAPSYPNSSAFATLQTFIGDTNPIVTKSVCTAIGAIVDNDLIDIFFFT